MMKNEKRSVAALLNLKPRGEWNRQKYLDGSLHTYIFCRSDAIAQRFLADAEAEGFRFGDGVLPTRRQTDDIFAITPDFTICYIGFAGHLIFREPERGNVVRIDYEKYMNGASDYQL